MKVPKDILDVPRPAKSYVKVYTKSKNKYAVIGRKGCQYTDGKGRVTICDRDGLVIGHIRLHEFVPKGDTPRLGKLVKEDPDIKSWANTLLCLKVAKDLLDELKAVYNESEAEQIFCVAVLRTCHPRITNEELYSKYISNMLSTELPGVGLSDSSVGRLFYKLGQLTRLIQEFFRNRVHKLAAFNNGGTKPSIIIDGTLITNYSKDNWYGANSLKTKLKGAPQYNLIQAFSGDLHEPLCGSIYRGNHTDCITLEDFLEINNIIEGLLKFDKGFSIARISHYLKAHPNLHYFKPIKRNCKVIKKYDLFNYERPLEFTDRVLGVKVKCEKWDRTVSGRDRYLYSFQDLDDFSIEENTWVKRAKKNKSYSRKAHDEAKQKFGTIVFDSDLDLTLEEAYLQYKERWVIETMMEFYKRSNDLNYTRVHSNYSIIGSEFCKFISMIITYKILNYLDSKQLRKYSTYKEIISTLGHVLKRRIKEDKWVLSSVNAGEADLLDKLDLLTAEERKKLFPAPVGRPRMEIKKEVPENNDNKGTEKRGPGRPKGSKNKPKTADNETSENIPKRGPGRPKGSKNKKGKKSDNEPPKIKRGPGRPKGSKNKKSLSQTEKKPLDTVDSLRIKEDKQKDGTVELPLVQENTKRGPGRPKGAKNKPKKTEDELNAVKRGPGRPKGSKKYKGEETEQPKTKRKPGRPLGSKKHKEETVSPKRKPGRPLGSKNKKKKGDVAI